MMLQYIPVVYLSLLLGSRQISENVMNGNKTEGQKSTDTNGRNQWRTKPSLGPRHKLYHGPPITH